MIRVFKIVPEMIYEGEDIGEAMKHYAQAIVQGSRAEAYLRGKKIASQQMSDLIN